MVKQKNRAKRMVAAYAASQPLFDAVRLCLDRLSQQETLLKDARSLIQTLHVQLKDYDNPKELRLHERYMDSCVKAWRIATENYNAVFTELAAVTGPDAEKGRSKQEGWEAFCGMRDSAREARLVAKGWETQADENKATRALNAEAKKASKADDSSSASSEASGSEDSGSDSDSSGASSSDGEKNRNNKRPAELEPAEPSKKAQRLTGKVRKGNQETLLWEVGAENPNVPFASLGSSEKKAWHHEKSRQKREKKGLKRREAKVKVAAAEGTNNIPDRRGPAPPPATEDTSKPLTERDYVRFDQPEAMDFEATHAPNVEYEDVDAEVEKRLKAKAKKAETDEADARAKKTEKKRKRESAGSNVGSGEGAVDSAVVFEGKPKKKKSKVDPVVAEPAAETDKADKKASKKRTKEVGKEMADVEISSKKRRKTKA